MIFKIIAKGSLEELENYLKSKPNSILSINSEGGSVLHAALESNHQTSSLARCETLWRHGADPKHLNHARQSIFHKASTRGREYCIDFFLKEENLGTFGTSGDLASLMNQRDDSGYTAADSAVQEEHLEILKRLYVAGASLHCQDSTGKGLLHTAIICSSGFDKTKGIIEWLLEHGVSLHQKDADGRGPADYAKGRAKLKQWLDEIQSVMIEREALNEVLSTVTPKVAPASATLSSSPRRI